MTILKEEGGTKYSTFRKSGRLKFTAKRDIVKIQ